MKEKIIAESILLFEKKGFNTTSIQDIVEKLGVTKGTFYYYFPSKEQLLMEIHYDYITSLLSRQVQAVNKEHTSQVEKLIEIIRILIQDIVEHGSSASVFFREMRHLGHENVETIKRIRKQIRLNVEKVIIDGIKKGEFCEKLRPDMVSFGIVGITNWSYNWFNPTGEVTAEELVEIFSHIILSGIKK